MYNLFVFDGCGFSCNKSQNLIQYKEYIFNFYKWQKLVSSATISKAYS